MNMRHFAAPIAFLTLACGSCGSSAPSADVLAAVPCTSWRPSDADWSSLPASRPAVIGALGASPSGRYLYTVGTWFDAGTLRHQILRSRDLGETWCGLATPDDVAEVAPSPASETVLYALTCPPRRTASLLRTTDGGATWATVTENLPTDVAGCDSRSFSLQTSVIDADVVWINGFNTDRHFGNTLHLSTVAGDTWTTVLPPPALVPQIDATDPLNSVEAGVDGIRADPRTGGRVLAWGRTARIGTAWGPERWFTSGDAGLTWREITVPMPAGDSEIGDFRAVADASSALYVSGVSSLLRSVDWGESWTAAGPLPDRLATVTTLGSPQGGKLFAWRTDVTSAWDAPTTVWTSADAGASWNALDVDPTIDPVLAPGGNVIVGLGRLAMSVTTNGGKSWSPRPIVPAPGSLAQSPVDWRPLWAGGYTTNTSPSTRAESLPGVRSTDGGLSWSTIADLDGPLLMDGANADVVYRGLYFQQAAPARTEDGGKTWASFSVPVGLIDAAASCPPPGSCLSLLLSFWAETELSCRLASSSDRGETWTERPVPAELCYGSPTLVVAPDDSDHLLAACMHGEGASEISAVCESRDGGQTWLPHQIGSDSQRTVGSIVFTGSGVALAATSPETTPGDTLPSVVARSTDGGTTWVEVPAEGGRLLASIARPETVFLLARRESAGYSYSILLRSDDAGASWTDVSPPAETANDPGFSILAIADSPRGGFIATTTYGLVQFE